MKLADAREDRYRILAEEQGYRSRAAFKLEQLNKSYHILREIRNVLDLGCAPGGWLQIVREVAPTAKVIGIDIKSVEPVDTAIILLQGNIQDEAIVAEIVNNLDDEVDLVLSDLAPNVKGSWDFIHAKQISLTLSALAITRKVLKKGGRALFKVYEGHLLSDLIDELKTSFNRVILSKPSASRPQSKELYVVCLDFEPTNVT